MTDLAEYGLMPEEWGGDTLVTKISAVTGEGIPDLLENILLIADLKGYKANPNRYAMGTVVESQLNSHLGPIVHVACSKWNFKAWGSSGCWNSFWKD